jgi:hypothetical protein
MDSVAEVVLRILLAINKIPHVYNQPLRGNGGWQFPDFVIPARGGRLIVVEYLGGWQQDSYREDWFARRLPWYQRNPQYILVAIYPGDDGEFDGPHLIEGVNQILGLLAGSLGQVAA